MMQRCISGPFLGDYDAKTVLTLQRENPVWTPGGSAQTLTFTQVKGKPQVILQISKGNYLAGTSATPVVSVQPSLWFYKRVARGNQAARDLMQAGIIKRGSEKVPLYEKSLRGFEVAAVVIWIVAFWVTFPSY